MIWELELEEAFLSIDAAAEPEDDDLESPAPEPEPVLLGADDDGMLDEVTLMKWELCLRRLKYDQDLFSCRSLFLRRPNMGRNESVLGALNNAGALYIHEHCNPELLSWLSQ